MLANQTPKLSVVLLDILNRAQADDASLQSLVDSLDSRAYGMILIILTLPSLIPGIASISSGIIFIFSIQMLIGVQRPKIPKQIKKVKIDARFCLALKHIIGYAVILERFIKPRWVFLSNKMALKCMGCVLMLFSLIVFIPIPFSNFIPAVSIFLIAERDGYEDNQGEQHQNTTHTF